MKRVSALAAGLVLAWTAGAGDVYMTRDAQGNPVYTDIPAALPAEKVGIRSRSTDPAEVQSRYDSQMKQYDQGNATKPGPDAEQPPALTDEELAKRCADARKRYQAYLDAFRLYEELPNGERRYLTNEELDAARADARQVMDRSCSDQ